MDTELEISILFDHFVNVDLFRKGYYYFKVTIISYSTSYSASRSSSAHGTDESVDKYEKTAVPYRTLVAANRKHEEHVPECFEASIDTENNAFSTRVFLVHYQNQRIRLNEGCSFKVLQRPQSRPRIYLMIELMYSESQATGSKSFHFDEQEKNNSSSQGPLRIVFNGKADDNNEASAQYPRKSPQEYVFDGSYRHLWENKEAEHDSQIRGSTSYRFDYQEPQPKSIHFGPSLPKSKGRSIDFKRDRRAPEEESSKKTEDLSDICLEDKEWAKRGSRFLNWSKIKPRDEVQAQVPFLTATDGGSKRLVRRKSVPLQQTRKNVEGSKSYSVRFDGSKMKLNKDMSLSPKKSNGNAISRSDVQSRNRKSNRKDSNDEKGGLSHREIRITRSNSSGQGVCYNFESTQQPDDRLFKERTPIVGKNKFRSIDRCMLCLRNSSQSVLVMYPVTFSSRHFCLTNLVVQTVSSNLKFEKRVQDGHFYRNLKEYLFPSREADSDAPSDQEWKTINRHHFKAITKLIQSYRTIRERINVWVDKYISPAIMRNLDSVFKIKQRFPYPDIKIPKILRRDLKLKQRFQFSNRESQSLDLIFQTFRDDVEIFSAQVRKIWNTASSLMVLTSSDLTYDLWRSWRLQRTNLWGKWLYREQKSEWMMPMESAESIRIRVTNAIQLDSRSVRTPIVQDTRFMKNGPYEYQAIGFEQTLSSGPKKRRTTLTLDTVEDRNISKLDDSVHLFILVHGYQGSSWDMRLFRNHLAVVTERDNTLFLVSEKNEGNTSEDIKLLGETLATEIVEFINYVGGEEEIGKISFVTHSLGGIIMREALTHPSLRGLLGKLYSYISLAVCHCGYLMSESKLASSGLWVIRMISRSSCLDQLSLSDHEDPRQTYIYKLSKQKGLEYFKNILLVSSTDDNFTPYHSARIEIPVGVTQRDEKWGCVFLEIVQNLLTPLTKVTVRITRFDLSFAKRPQNKFSLDGLVGRNAHILFLEHTHYIMQLLYHYPQFFLTSEESFSDSAEDSESELPPSTALLDDSPVARNSLYRITSIKV